MNNIKTKAILRKGKNYQQMYVGGRFFADIWGVATVKEPTKASPTYMVCIDGSLAFFHTDEVEWREEKDNGITRDN